MLCWYNIGKKLNLNYRYIFRKIVFTISVKQRTFKMFNLFTDKIVDKTRLYILLDIL